jgi:nucleoside-diphosphate kinase
MIEQTLAIIKPDAVAANQIGEIIKRIEAEKFAIRAMKMLHLTKAQAEGFYAVHRERPFFESLTTFMSGGPCVVLLLERESAISHWRDVMGATDPAKAAEGTIRRALGSSIERNATHGSDAPETAAFEISFFFNGLERIR